MAKRISAKAAYKDKPDYGCIGPFGPPYGKLGPRGGKAAFDKITKNICLVSRLRPGV